VEKPARRFLVSCLLLTLISLGTLFCRLGSLPFTGADEPRYARIAEEMREAGRWVTPLLEGRPWLEKPPLYYWITIPLISLFGVGETSARLGPALLALLSSYVILWLGTRLWSRLAGFLGAIIFLTSLGTVGYGRSASTDMPMAACLTATLAILLAAATDEKLATWKIWGSYLFLGLAVLAKGPVAPVLAAGVGTLFWCLDEKGGLLRRWKVATGLAIVCAICLPWFWLVFQENGFSFVTVFLINHNLARYITDIHHHTEPFYYYAPVLLGLFFPWSGWLLILSPGYILESLRRWRRWDRPDLFLACWILFPLLFFSFSSSKLAGYILPVLAPFSLLLGARFARWFAQPARRPATSLAAWLHLILSVAVAAAFPLLFWKNFGGNWAAGLPLSAVNLIPAFFGFRWGRLGNGSGAFKATAIQGLVLVLAMTQFLFPVLGQYHSTKNIAGRALALREMGEAIVTYQFFHHTLHYYTGYQIADDLPDRESLIRFAESHRRFLVVGPSTSLADLEDLPGFSATLLAGQGRLRLLRLARH
jgi:4-amino-4-deoxy-L-arabinose transferase-like glycosyltransferase